LGFTLEEIASLLSLTGPDCEDVQALATRKLDLVREKVADLEQIEAALVKGVQNCQTRGQPNTCPLLESFTKNG
jgi:MerR family mercuric resistance operon transcriptional regulator